MSRYFPGCIPEKFFEGAVRPVDYSITGGKYERFGKLIEHGPEYFWGAALRMRRYPLGVVGCRFHVRNSPLRPMGPFLDQWSLASIRPAAAGMDMPRPKPFAIHTDNSTQSPWSIWIPIQARIRMKRFPV